MLTVSLGQTFRPGKAGSVCLCSTMSNASAGRCRPRTGTVWKPGPLCVKQLIISYCLGALVHIHTSKGRGRGKKGRKREERENQVRVVFHDETSDSHSITLATFFFFSLQVSLTFKEGETESASLCGMLRFLKSFWDHYRGLL